MLKTISLISLLLTILPSLFFLVNALSLDSAQWAALVGTIVWFIVTPLWMGHSLEPGADEPLGTP